MIFSSVLYLYRGEDIMTDKMFNDIINSKYHKYTFYIHNLARFDSVLILDSLSRFDDFKMKCLMKDDNMSFHDSEMAKLPLVQWQHIAQ